MAIPVTRRQALDLRLRAHELWAPADRTALSEQVERLAAYQGLALGTLDLTG